MKKLFNFLLLLLPFTLFAQSFTTTAITNDFIRPGAGATLWNDVDAPFGTINIPVSGSPQESKDYYFRFSMTDFFGNSGAADSTIIFTRFDQKFQYAIDHRQAVRFRVMSVCNNCSVGFNTLISYDGAQSAIPQFLHNLMQGESVKDWKCSNGDQIAWIPNWNSLQFRRWVSKLSVAIRAHIDATIYKGIRYKNVLDIYDIGYYGIYAEQHSAGIVNNSISEYPTGTFGTASSLNALLDVQASAFTGGTWKMVIPENSLDCEWLPHTMNPIAYGQHIVDHPDSIGVINDHLRANEGYDHSYLEDNNRMGGSYNTRLMNRWRFSPWGGEPVGWGSPADGSALPDYMTFYHMSFFGNGNLNAITNADVTNANNVRLASKIAGYRLRITGGSVNTSGGLTINTNWINDGVAPVYRYWRVQYLLKNGAGTTVSTLTSAFTPRYFQPANAPTTKIDVFATPAIPTGTYGLYVIINDTSGYRRPMPLAITNRQADSSYFLTNITLTGGPPVNQLPTVNAGVNQSITGTTASVSATASDPDGTIVSYLWAQANGPNTATITSPSSFNTSITGLVAGSYDFVVTVTDNSAGTANDHILITVNTNQPPVSNAGANQVITLPTSSVSVSGSTSTDDVGIVSYLWAKVAGPGTFVITTPAASGTTITGLTTAGVYTFRLTVTDGSGLTSTDDMTVTVNAGNTAPVSNAGANQTITLPTSTVSLSGSLSTDNVGIVSYAWSKAGGPVSGTITTPTTVNTTVTGLVTGTYIFRLRVTDVAGLFNDDDVQITVLAAPNTAPVANAGANQNITLPVNSVNVSGSASTDNLGIVSYSWARLSGPLTFTITTPNSVNTSITGLIAGIYQFRLTVADASGLTATDDVDITVNAAPNNAPIANAGANQAITLPTASVTLSGTASTDDVAVTAYLWTKVSGTGGNIINPTGSSTLITGLTAGNYLFRLRVTDAGGLFSTDDVVVQVNPAANNAPVAAAGNNQTITLPTNIVTLSASGSSDDAGIVGYQWQKISGTGGVISSPTSSSTSVINLVQGTYTFRLTVTDGFGLTDTDDVQVTVNSQPPPDTDSDGRGRWWQFWRWIFKRR